MSSGDNLMHRGQGMMNFNPWMIWIPILLVALIGLAIYMIYKNNRKNLTSLDVLNRRYARGELSEEDYLRMKDQIKDSHK